MGNATREVGMRPAWMRPLVFLLVVRVLAAPVSWDHSRKEPHGHRLLTMRCWPAPWLHRVAAQHEGRRDHATSPGAADMMSTIWSRPHAAPHAARERDRT